ncbi:NADPH-dependent FMN reductase [Nonomuraea sp. NPDC050536]|uniref:NADPH-dependent FMN reductase n=1 Tax=Nonomuraea sp. NPDC050536 TaxID=3364366 RepID=UPI0037C5FB82
MPTLNVILASTRPGRAGEPIARWFAQTAREHGSFDVRLVDLAELNLPMLDEPTAAIEGEPYLHEHTRRWSAITAAADAFVLVMPEYNRGYSAPLKNALDYLYHEWLYKPVGFVGYGMSSAGMRAVQSIKPVLTALKMMPVDEAVHVHLRGFTEPTPSMAEAAKEMLDELALLASAFSALREAQPV